MRTLILFIIVIPVLAFTNKFDDRWIFLYENIHSNNYYDSESITSDGNRKSIWIKQINKELGYDPIGNLEIDYILNQYEFNCSNRKYLWIQQVIKRINGTSRSVEYPLGDYKSSVVPNTIEEEIFNVACN